MTTSSTQAGRVLELLRRFKGAKPLSFIAETLFAGRYHAAFAVLYKLRKRGLVDRPSRAMYAAAIRKEAAR